MSNTDPKIETTDTELIVTRIFDAPRELVFAAYSSCEHIKNWYGTRSCLIAECTMDFRVGGVWHYCLRDPHTGEESWSKAIYQEIIEPELIAYSSAVADAAGNINETMPKMRSRVELSDVDGKAQLILRAAFSSPSDLQQVLSLGVIPKFAEALKRLEKHLAARVASDA